MPLFHPDIQSRAITAENQSGDKGKGARWGEGEVKIFVDGDKEFPTICGTGSEDYAGSDWGLGQFHAREMGAPLIDG